MHNRLKTESRWAKNKRITEQLERAFKQFFLKTITLRYIASGMLPRLKWNKRLKTEKA